MSNPNPYPGPAFAGLGAGAGVPFNRYPPNIPGHSANGYPGKSHPANGNLNRPGIHPAFHQNYNYQAPSQRPIYQNPSLNNQLFQANANIAPAVPGNHTSLPYAHTHTSVPPEFTNHFPTSNYQPLVPPPFHQFGVTAFQQPPPPQNQTPASTPRGEITRDGLAQSQGYHQASTGIIATQTDQTSHTVSKEDGELSEGELDQSPVERAVTNGENPKNGQAQIVQPASKILSSAADKTSDPNHKMGNVLERISGQGESALPAPDNDSTSSYNPPSASSLGSDGALLLGIAPTQENAKTAEQRSIDSSRPTINDTLPLRQQVKDTLRALDFYNIKFDQLVDQGIDPEVLKRLYQDIKSDDEAEAKKTNPFNANPRPEGHPAVQDQSRPAPRAETGPSLVPRQNSVIAKSTTPSSSLNSRPSSLDPAKAPSSSIPAKAALPAEKVMATGSAAATSMERKDRIAQLLASKTGKVIAAKPRPEAPQKKQTIAGTTDQPKKDAKTNGSPAEKAPIAPTTVITKTRSKLQTELVRKKMEALKREALAKAQLQAEAAVSSSTSLSDQPPPNPASQMEDRLVQSRATPEQLDYQIPGLFMTRDVDVGETVVRAGQINQSRIVTDAEEEPIATDSASEPVSQAPSIEREAKSAEPIKRDIAPISQKRSLALDAWPESGPPSKRQFQGQAEDSPQIISSSSEEEGEVDDVAMELDEESEQDSDDPAEHSSVNSVQEITRESPPQTLPASAGLPNSRRPLTSSDEPVSSALTSSPTPTETSNSELLARNIKLMHQRIAEAEERKRLRAQQNPAQANPAQALPLSVPNKPPPPAIRTSLARSSLPSAPHLNKMSESPSSHNTNSLPRSPDLGASRPADLPVTPTTPLSALKEPVKTDDLRQKLLRRQSTREGTPGAAEIERLQVQLAERRAKMREMRLEAERREAQMMEETRMLEAQLQAGLDEELAGDDDFMQDDELADGETSVVDSHGLLDEASRPGSRNGEGIVVSIEGDCASPLSPPGQGPVLAMRTDTDEANLLNHEEVDVTASQDEAITDTNPAASQTVPEMPPPPKNEMQTNTVAVSPSEEAAPTASQYAFLAADGLAQDSPQKPPNPFDNDYLNEEGSVSMADSDSEDYEPAEPEGSSEGEIYEHEPQVATETSIYVKEQSPSPPREYEPMEAMEHEQPTRGEEVPVTQLKHEQEEHQMVDEVIVGNGTQLTTMTVNDMPQMPNPPHPAQYSTETNSQQPPLSQHDVVVPAAPPPSQPGSHFTPYQTPRKYFKNFRYHPDFTNEVKDGHRSLTYSNKIDVRAPFCPAELVGGQCPDPRCELQHFSQIGMTDDAILQQMSVANNLSPDDRQRWVAGLRLAIADLRNNPVKDFALVAKALAAYRRRFTEEMSTAPSVSASSPS